MLQSVFVFDAESLIGISIVSSPYWSNVAFHTISIWVSQSPMQAGEISTCDFFISPYLTYSASILLLETYQKPVMNIGNLLNGLTFTDAEIETFVSEELPKWKKECDANENGNLSFHQSAFGNSIKELLLLAIAIKYAKRSGKGITVISGDMETPVATEIR